MEKTHIPTWTEANAVRYHLRTSLEQFVWDFDPGHDADKFRAQLSKVIEHAKRHAIKSAKKRKTTLGPKKKPQQ